MFKTKQDVDKHVTDILKKIKNDSERDLKCISIARLYMKVAEYEQALKYVKRYMSRVPTSTSAYKVLGEAYEGLGDKNKAVDAYKSALELDGKQSDLLIRVCQLLTDTDVSVDKDSSCYWLERAENQYPKHPVVFQLKERLLKTNHTVDMNKLEQLYLSAIMASPNDVKARIRLVELFINSGRSKAAYQYASEVNDHSLFNKNVSWFDCLVKLTQAYERENSPRDVEFQVAKISWLERRVYLCLEDFHCEHKKSLADCSAALFSFDQALYKASQFNNFKQFEDEMFKEIMNHMQCQLSFHFATLVLKRTKREHGPWSKSISAASPLLLQATASSMDLDGSWYLTVPNSWKKSKLLNQFESWNGEAAFRISQAGHVLLGLAKNVNLFLENVSKYCGGKWRDRVYQDVFFTREHLDAVSTSHFMNNNQFADVILKLPTPAQLFAFDNVAQAVHPDLLQYITWLGLVHYTDSSRLHEFRCTIVEDLQFSVKNLNNTGPETLNQLDVDAFLYATVLCAASNVLTTGVNSDKPKLLPAGICEELCTGKQSEWWKAVCETYKDRPSGNISGLRYTLRKGIETIRAFGAHGLDVVLIVMLARLFEERAKNIPSAETVDALDARTSLYWTAAIPTLERLEKNQLIRDTTDRLFQYKRKELTMSDITKYLEDGKLFLACQLMKENKNEEAIQAFHSLKSPYATFYQAMIYKKLASEEVDRKPELITSENRSQHIILLTRARDGLFLTLDRLRSPTADQNHPLNEILHSHLEEIETQLCRIDPDSNNFHRHEEGGSDESDVAGPLSPVGVGHNYSSYTNNLHQSTPRAMRHNTLANDTSRHNNISRHTRTEARPSPERLDAQLRHVVQSFNSGIHSLIEQNNSIIQELKDLKSVVQEIVPELKKLSTKLDTAVTSKPADDLKDEDLYVFPDDEEYAEDINQLNQLNQQFPQFPNYGNFGNFRPMPGVQGTSTLTYGAPGAAAAPHANLLAPNAAAPLFSQPFFTGQRPAIDPMLLYQSLSYYQQLPFSEGQTLPDFRPQAAPIPAPVPNTVSFDKTPQVSVAETSKPQPPNVVITSSDTLPAFTGTSTPAMSVTIPPQHLRSNQPHAFQIPMPPEAHLIKENPLEPVPSRTTTINSLPTVVSSASSAAAVNTTHNSSVSEDADTVEAEHDPCPDFKPIIPLPDEVQVTTGEESEVKLFESRAKLFRFVGSEWKERGIGQLKILHNEATNSVRVVMRREQVLKICANHLITSDMELCRLSNHKQAWVWIANDYADEQVCTEKFCARFKTIDEASDFEAVFAKARKIAKENESKPKQTTAAPLIVSKEQQNSWECSGCYIKNKLDVSKCIACQSSKPGTLDTSTDGKIQAFGFTFLRPPVFQPAPGDNDKTKPKEIDKEPATKPNPFAGFTLKTSSTTPADSKFVFGTGGTVDKKPEFNFGVKPAQDLSKKIEENKLFSSPVLSTDGFSSLAQNGQVSEAFKVTESFKGFDGTGSLVFGGVAQQAKNPQVKKINVQTTQTKEDEEEVANESTDYEPAVEFTPVIPLPDLIEVKTGEEDESVLYQERSKLLRFDAVSKEWKERGIGNMKILLDEKSGRVRLLMRREQVLKVCCNHYLTADMEFKPMTTSDKAVLWCAEDFAEGELRTETFALRFARSELMQQFKSKIEEVQKRIKDGSVLMLSPLPVVKKEAAVKLVIRTARDKLKPLTDLWECAMCHVSNDICLTECMVCDTPRFGEKETETKPVTAFGFSGKFKPKPGSWECSTCMIRNDLNVTVCECCNTPKPGTTAEQPGKKEPKGIVLDPKLATMFTFGIPQNTTEQIKPAAETTKPAFLFGTPSVAVTTAGITNTFSFTPTQQTDGGDSFKFGSSNKFTFSFSGVKSVGASPGTPGGVTTADESEQEVEEDEGEHIHFSPIIPLPDKIAVVTGEEDEEVLYCHRAKLFRYVGSDWKERGVGDFKILRHKTDKKIRFLMRRDQVLKVCLNHYVAESLDLKVKDDKSFIWCAADFSEGEVEQSNFALRFKTPEIASEFKSVVDNFMKGLKCGEDVVIGGKESSPAMKDFKFVVPAKTNESKPVSRKLFDEKSDIEVEIVYEARVTDKERDDALRLQLPPNFYAYRSAPKCPGCVGCEPDSEEDASSCQTTRDKSNSTIVKPSLFSTGENAKGIFGAAQDVKADSSTSITMKASMFAPTTDSPITKSIFNTQSIFGNNLSGATDSDSTKTGNIFGSTTAGENSGFFFGASKPQQGFIFGAPAKTTTDVEEKTESGLLFGSNVVSSSTTEPVKQSDSETKETPFSFASFNTDLTFASLKDKGEFKPDPSKSKPWDMKPQPVFGKKTEEGAGDSGVSDNEADGEHNASGHDPQFAPIVPLPDAIEVRTGEEDEEKIFCERAKLFRFDANSKEWKERGVGEMKILYHPVNGTYRFLLRREQVHKIVCNHWLTTNLTLGALSSSDKAWCWGTMNYAEETGVLEELAVRFKSSELADKFKEKVLECQEKLKIEPLLPVSISSSSTIEVVKTEEEKKKVYDEEEDDDDDDETDDDDDDVDEEEEEEYDDDQAVVVLEKSDFIFYEYSGDTDSYEIVGQNPIMQVFEVREDTYRLHIEDAETGELLSKTYIDKRVSSVFRVTPVDCIWLALDHVPNPPNFRTLLLHFPSEDDLNEFLRYFGQIDMPKEMNKILESVTKFWESKN